MARQSIIGGQPNISFHLNSTRQTGGVLGITPGTGIIGSEAVNPSHIGFTPRAEPRTKIDSLVLPGVHSNKTTGGVCKGRGICKNRGICKGGINTGT